MRAPQTLPTLTLLCLCAALTLMSAAKANAADYPTRFVTIVVPFPPGGTLDVQARAIAAQMGETFKQPVVVENRPGAGATIGAGYVAKAAPDGYTLLITLQSLAISPSVYANLPFDPVKDLEPVSLIESTFWILCGSPSLSARTFKDFVALAKARPGTLNYASTGLGTDNHITMEQLQKAAGIQITHIPFNGAGPAMNAMVGGQVDVMLVPGAIALPYIKTGKLTPMAVLAAARSPVVPDVPTLAEEGLPGFEQGSWTALFAPKATPKAIVLTLNAEIQRILERRTREKTLFIEGLEVPRPSTPDELGALLRDDVARWRRLAEEAGVPRQ